MVRIFIIVILAIVSVGAATLFLAQQPGGIEFDLFGVSGSLPLVGAVLAMVAIGGVAALGWFIAVGLVRLPWTFGRSRKRVRIQKANKALADGLLAAEAGDAKTAALLAKKAAKYADDERMKLLLEARTAEVSGDWIGAERAWGLLARLPGGELAGLRGAASAAMERGDAVTAETNTREALTLKSGADWPFSSLFDLQVSRQEWAKALDTLAIGEKRGLINGDAVRRRRAVLKTAHAVALPRAEKIAAQRALAEAIKAAPGFPPAAWHGAHQLMRDGKAKAALGVIELAWKAAPHPALAHLAKQILASESALTRTRRLKALIETQPEHRESRILASELAIDTKRWTDAVRALALLVEEEPTARLCLLMERALGGYGDEVEAARWARMAVTAAREADWSDLDPKGGAFSFDGADWARLVYRFGDAGQLVHPRHEQFGRELDATRPALGFSRSGTVTGDAADTLPPSAVTAPIDYVPSKD